MTINLTDPNWIGVILAAAAALVGITHFITKSLLERGRTNRVVGLSEEQAITILRIHQNSVASEVARRMAAFFYTAEIKGRVVTEEKVEELRKEMIALLKEKRELLRVFRVTKGRLDEIAAMDYDGRVDKDFDRLKKISLSQDLTSFEKAERIQEAIRQIQVDSRARVNAALKE